MTQSFSVESYHRRHCPRQSQLYPSASFPWSTFSDIYWAWLAFFDLHTLLILPHEHPVLGLSSHSWWIWLDGGFAHPTRFQSMTSQAEQISHKMKKSRYPNTNNLGLPRRRSMTDFSRCVCVAACYEHSEKLDTMFEEWYAYHSSHHCTCPCSYSDLSRSSGP